MLSALRRKVGAWVGGFEAGLGNRRLKGFQPSRAHVNTLIAAAGSDITARARHLVRNNGYAANAIESWAGNVVGAGIKPSSLITDATVKAAVQKLWLAWTDESDAEGLTDFYGQQRRAAREVFIAGEVFFRFRPRRPEDGLSVPLQLQMLPSEMLPQTRNQTLPSGNIIRQGIEFDRIGRRVAYHLYREHPGERLMFANAYIRLTTPEAYLVHRDVIEWNSDTSETRIPDQAIGADPLTLKLMRWAMQSWERVDFLNRYLMGTLMPRLQMDLLPGLACGAHFALVAAKPPADVDDYLAAGRQVQRFWLTATRLGLELQPEMTPIIFSRYVREGRDFSRLPRPGEIAAKLGGRLAAEFSPIDPARLVFLGRIGAGPRAKARSTRLPVERLLRAE